jgi:dolichol-phosphate mannosyltransferase
MISVVIPVFNEQENLHKLVSRLEAASKDWGDSIEVIFVDDGSRDQTLPLLEQINHSHPNFKYVSLSRNFGHQTAVTAGLDHVSGDVVAIMDADLQDPPEVLPRFLEKWREGYEVVYAVRTQRKENFLKRGCYWLFYRTLKLFSSIDIPLDSGDFCVMDRRVVDLINSLPERNRFVRGLRSWVGFKQIGVPYERDARSAGEVKYTVRKLVRLALDGLISFTHRPLQLIGIVGFLLATLAFSGLGVYLFLSIFNIPIFGHSPRDVPGFTTLILTLLLLGGVQLLSLGIMGEYIARIFDEVKNRPIYVVKHRRGFSFGEDAPTGIRGFSFLKEKPSVKIPNIANKTTAQKK